MDSEQERDKKEGQESTEEKRVMDFLHSCSIPLFFKLKQLPLCAAVRELEVIASSFHRLALVDSSGQLSTNRQLRRTSFSLTCPKVYQTLICFQDHPSKAHTPPFSLRHLPAFTFPFHCSIRSPPLFHPSSSLSCPFSLSPHYLSSCSLCGAAGST